MTKSNGPRSAGQQSEGPEKSTTAKSEASSAKSTDRALGHPFAEVVSIRAMEHTRLMGVRCPHCGRKHTHGLPWGDTEQPMHRVAVCASEKGGGGYYIDVPARAYELRRPVRRRSVGGEK